MARLLILCVLLCGCYVPKPSPVPPTPDNNRQIASAIEAAASRCMRSYPERIAIVYEQLAEELRAGRFASANQFGDELERRATECREQTFAEFRGTWGNSQNWSAEADAEKCIRSAAGFRGSMK